jgi:hypothetical protein
MHIGAFVAPARQHLPKLRQHWLVQRRMADR